MNLSGRGKWFSVPRHPVVNSVTLTRPYPPPPPFRASKVTPVQKSNTHSLGSSCSQPPDKEAQRRCLAWVCLALMKPRLHKTASATLQGLLPEEFLLHYHSEILFSFRISTHGAWGQKATGNAACVGSIKGLNLNPKPHIKKSRLVDLCL